jgi:hypothetical protein
MARITVSVKVSGKHYFDAPAYGAPWSTERHYIHTFTAEDGTVYVWKTTSSLMMEIPYTGRPGYHNFEDRKGNPIDYVSVNKDDEITITATVKGVSEYKGQKQTELTRVKVTARTFRAETEEERNARIARERAAKRDEQLASIADGDKVVTMAYARYKEHYSDCETVEGSFKRDNKTGDTRIDVIVRAGRMKNSGVRGEHFAGYEIEWFENGEKCFSSFRAVSEENAMKQARKSAPTGTGFNCRKVYFHRGYHHIV